MEKGAKHVEVEQPTMSYKLAFLIGGAAFALAAYLMGTVIYEVEIVVSGRQFGATADLAGAIHRIFSDHLVTFIPWVVGNIGLSVTLGYLYDKQVKFRQQAEELRARAEAIAVTDGLTLLYNHRFLIEQLGLGLKRAERQSYLFSVLFVDIDDFKRYNDTHGHLAGDDALRLVALAIKATVRETDIVGRYGGEEMVVIALGSDKEFGAKLAERVRERIERSCPVTVSIGVASFPDDGDQVNDLIKAADAAMYQAKRSGKNRVVVVQSEPVGPVQAVQGNHREEH